MSDSSTLSSVGRAVGFVMLVVGVSVFVVRLQHPGPYAWPEGGNLRAGAASLAIALWLLRDWNVQPALARMLTGVAIVASPIALVFGIYAFAAEIEEVVVLQATQRSGETVDLRLWVVDDANGATWVSMPREKAAAHALGEGGSARLLRAGEWRCVAPVLFADREHANLVYRLRDEKYAVQRAAAAIGYFGDEAKPGSVALRLDRCPSGA